MLFNSVEFLFFFFPVVLLGFFALGGLGKSTLALAWLVATSLFFYGWWNPSYLGLIGISIVFNFWMGLHLGNLEKIKSARKNLLILGVSANLAALAWFKYANFMVDNLRALTGVDWELASIVLPLAISFFTFQQIAYLVGAYRGETRELSFLRYCLFVTFFPQLIAGPIVHHKEMLPQFADSKIYRFNKKHFSIGLTIFFVGLFKKVVFADNVAIYASPVFSAAAEGTPIPFLEAWGGVLAYTLQLYFDFSGYSDMAIGLGRMFGIRLPLNFNSPYKARNIVDFWRRWHLTLSRFLRDYLYISLGGNRKGPVRRYMNLYITMVLGGLWHGAGWTFVIWGSLHGAYLIVNHAWHHFRKRMGQDVKAVGSLMARFSARTLTFFAVILGWVFFRAKDFDAAWNILRGMGGQQGIQVNGRFQKLLGFLGENTSVAFVPETPLFLGREEIRWIVGLLLIAFFGPNTQQLLFDHEPAFETYPREIRPHAIRWLRWKPTLPWAIALSLIATYAILGMSTVSEFLYFQF